MYKSPSSRGGGGSSTPYKHGIPSSGPIAEFSRVIEETPPDQWQPRSAALRKIVDSVPEGSAYAMGDYWYNSPPMLRHLALPIGELLKDPRSTVVKRTCEGLTRLFLKCQSDGRYLFKDIMPVILSVHAQTVQIIRTAVQDMVMEIIPEVPCKMVMPLWMERLKVDKSRTVREACALYLGRALQCWTEENYLTEEIWMQVGSTLLRTLRDPSPQARTHAKTALERFGAERPDLFDRLANDADGPAGKDPKMQRWLLTLKQGKSPDEAEELSVASKFSYNSETKFRVTSGSFARTGSPANRRYLPNIDKSPPPEAASPVPTSIRFMAAAKSKEAEDDANAKLDDVLGPSTTAADRKMVSSRPTVDTGNGNYAKPFQRVMETPPRPSTTGTPPRHPSTPNSTSGHKSPAYLNTIEDNTDNNSITGSETDIVESNSFPSDLNAAFDKAPRDGSITETPKATASAQVTATIGKPPRKPVAVDTAVAKLDEEGPFIASMQELKKHASQRRSRNSILMAERFKISGSFSELDNGDEEPGKQGDHGAASDVFAEEEEEKLSPIKPFTTAPEHMVIAIRLLRAHKEHVDNIMETLKIEMDTLRDFDKLLEQPGRPTEEEVLDYFESVGLCLDQRNQAGSSLQKEMDRISRGEPPQE
ncbi:hypothetical protein MPSEU_000067900 [Mayamaea pseudoterrestris]|nr:hypothetical protein MPSEU_000067900 [Mayamaea pseudoterrestris]